MNNKPRIVSREEGDLRRLEKTLNNLRLDCELNHSPDGVITLSFRRAMRGELLACLRHITTRVFGMRFEPDQSFKCFTYAGKVK